MRNENRVQHSQAVTAFEREKLRREQWNRETARSRADAEKRVELDKWRDAVR
ncbi:MAG TPA: hypothetical protein VHW01_13285 [Polyangiaceae bacterium]|nr:hypothetical protein [Polyangiaceae bacterium]